MKPGDRIRSLQGPILVLGASGFVGANLARTLLEHRADVIATTSRTPAWRLEDLPARNVREFDALVALNVDRMLDEVRPRTVFNCIAYGAYSFETDGELILRTNLMSTHALLERLTSRNIAAYIHAGSSSEYGENAAGPEEHDFLAVNSEYAVSKAACAHLIHYYGKQHGLPSANLRLYSVYGPLEDPSRLMPKIVQHGVRGELPPLVDPHIARDFVYSDDVVDAFVAAASELREDDYGDSFNVGTGRQTTIGELAEVARELYGIEAPASFTMPPRRWDIGDWYANSARAQKVLGWEARTPLEDGLERMTSWYRALASPERYRSATKEVALDAEHSITAVIACYRDAQAIPVMHRRLTETFAALGIDYEIIFVNDASPDDSEQVIREISERDRRVLGISHSRNFGSQAAFRSGMELATKNAVVLLDGDLQDPPELIAQFVERWKEGYDVVYGRRVSRETTFFMQRAYRAFYWAFDRFSYLSIPRDAGDFSLMDRRVVHAMLQCDERDLFLRGVRAFVGFRQTGVDYVRPKRMFGETTNNLRRNIGWAKKGIFSFSNVPLTMLSFAGTVLFLLSLVLAAAQGVARVVAPDSAPRGVATLVILVLLFGSLNLFAIGLVGEYLARVFEEVKRRPLYVRSSIVRDGEVRLVSPSADARSASLPG
ncbi:MAG: polyisoprenyl-phosphate glycosyltransferase [Gaiellales bacterium]|nr:polyisoprenyl-phosphate glycosyltransferase [Gaiellales bacterium]